MSLLTIEVRPEAFPGLLCDLARACGVPAAWALADLAGGTRLYVPHRPTPRLTEALGRDAAGWLSTQYAGDTVGVPTARRLKNWVEAKTLRQRGMSHPRIARRLHVSQRYLERLLSGLPAGVQLADTADTIPEAPAPCPLCGHLPRAKALRRQEPDERQFFLPF